MTIDKSKFRHIANGSCYTNFINSNETQPLRFQKLPADKTAMAIVTHVESAEPLTIPDMVDDCRVTFLYIARRKCTIRLPKYVDDIYVDNYPVEGPFRVPAIPHIFFEGENDYLVTDKNGSLYSKDMRRLLYLNAPAHPEDEPQYEEVLRLPETLEQIDESVILEGVDINLIIIPSGVKRVFIRNTAAMPFFEFCNRIEDVEIVCKWTGNVYSMDDKQCEDQFRFLAPAPDATPAEGSLVTFTMGRQEYGDWFWSRPVTINAAYVMAIYDVELSYVVEHPYYGTRIILAAEMEDGCKYVDVYENRTFVKQKLQSAGWGK